MSDLAIRSSTVVPASEWIPLTSQADYLAKSDIIPRDYRGKPANIVVAGLSGRTHGWDLLTSMRNGHVIEGTWGLRPEAQLGLVRRAGHTVTGTMSPEGAEVTGTRADDGSSMTVTFTIEDARRANLAAKQTWKNYPQMMCWWRAIGILCRVHFSDVTLGLMSVEELGADIGPDGEVIDVGEIEHERTPVPLSPEAVARFAEACETECLDPADVIRRAFPDDPEGVPTDADLPHLRDVFKQMVEERAAADSTDADANFVRDEIAEGVLVPDDPAPADPETVRPATRTQVGKIKGEWDRLGVKDREVQLGYVATIVGREVASHNALTTDEASGLIDTLVETEHLDA
jgi:hypothetical protein